MIDSVESTNVLAEVSPVSYVALIPANLLSVDPDLCRLKSRLSYISQGYDPMAVGEVVVSERDDGNFVIIDGVRRVGVIRTQDGDDKEVRCFVIRGLSKSNELKLRGLRNRCFPINGHEEFRILYHSGDALARQVRNAVESVGKNGMHLGFQIVVDPKKGRRVPNSLTCTMVLYRSARDFGISVVSAAMKCVWAAYATDSGTPTVPRSATSADFIRGVILCCNDLMLSDKLHPIKLAATLQKKDPVAISLAATSILYRREVKGGARSLPFAISMHIQELYQARR